VKEHCRLVAVLGMGGIGKTALGVKLAEQVQHSFEYLIWRSLRHAPPVQDTLGDLIKFFSNGKEIDLPETVNGRISRLLEHLRAKRCLLLLDDVETVLRSGELAGQYREGYEGYGELIQRVGEERHQSCLILISREKPIEISSLAGATLPVRALRLTGLQKDDAKKLLKSKGFSSVMRGAEELIELYRGNPLALKIIATTIQEVFNGDISQFIQENTLVVGDIISTILYQQFERLSTLENLIIHELAIANRPISLQELRSALQFSASSLSQLLPALESLKRRSLLEEEKNSEIEASFTLQPVIMKYVKTQLLEQICKDICTIIETQSIDNLGLLRSLNLVKDQQKDNMKSFSIHFPLSQVIDRLNMTLSSADRIEEQLNQVLSMLQNKSPQALGYAQSNILNLLKVAEGELQRL
jgi:DNA-binding transcriptional regulator GbsR (MarR family)